MVVLSQDSWIDDVAVFGGLAGVDVDYRYYSCGSSFVGDLACQVEFDGEDVVVICECDCELYDEQPVADSYGFVGPPIDMFP